MILIVGARGTLGSRVAKRLLAAGRPVGVVGRDPAGVAPLAALGALPVQGDLLDDGWLDGALDGVESVVVASHGLGPPSRRNHPGAVDGDGARRLIDAAARAGVRHLVYVSVAGADRGSDAFARVKLQTERHLAASGVPYTILRPAVFTEAHALLLLGEPVRSGRPVQFVGPATGRLNRVSAEDVADEVVEALGDERGRGQIRELRGPDDLSRTELLGIVEAALGRPGRRQHLPLPIARLVHVGARVVHPGVAYLLGVVLAEGAARPAPSDVAIRMGTPRVADVVARWAQAAGAAG